MTIAVCVFCGSLKYGAVVCCKSCGATPASEREIAYSLFLSDHHFDHETLQQISNDMQGGKPHPILPKDQEEVFLSQAQKYLSMFGDLFQDSMKRQRDKLSQTDDPLRVCAQSLLSVSKVFAISSLTILGDRFPFLVNVDRSHWDYVLTVAGVFMGATRLERIPLTLDRKDLARREIGASLLDWSADGGNSFDDCKSLFEKEYDRLSAADGNDPLYIGADALGLWIVWNVLGHAPKSADEAELQRTIGIMVIHAVFNHWRDVQANGNELFNLLRDLDDCISEYVSVHKEVWSLNPRKIVPIPLIFQRTDFSQYAETIRQVVDRLSTLGMALARVNPTEAEIPLTYVRRLQDAARKLQVICVGLHEIVRGGSYKWKEFNSDVDEYENLIACFQDLERKLNSWRRSASGEIKSVR